MKKLFFALLALAVVLGCAAALGETTFQSAGFEYALLPDGGAELIAYLGEAGEVTIPNELDWHPVTAVRRNPFAELYETGLYVGLTPCTVTVAADHPCLRVTDGLLYDTVHRKLICCEPSRTGEAVITDGTLTVADAAFYGCEHITAVTIPDSVTEIGVHTFDGCREMRRVTLPAGITAIGDYAFCTSGITSLTIPDSVTRIGAFAFRGAESLTELTIPDSVTDIGGYAFSFCTGLTSVTLSDSLTVLGQEVFCWCVSLDSVTIPEGVTRIGNDVFFGCTALKSVTIPDSVTEIGVEAFSNCTALKSLRIPAGVQRIGRYAFHLIDSDGNFRLPPLLTLSVTPGSAAEAYCRENGLRYALPCPDEREDEP